MNIAPWDNTATAANGELIRDNFASWFGASKVTDGNGLPLMLHHGTADDFEAFNIDFSFDGGFHFGTSAAAHLRLKYIGGKDYTEFEPGYPPRILPVYLSITNPLRLHEDPHSEDVWGEIIYAAQKAGHDGIVYKNEYEGGESWVAFRPEQIKSAIGNAGLYLKDSGDLCDTQAALQLSLARAAAQSIPAAPRSKELAP